MYDGEARDEHLRLFSLGIHLLKRGCVCTGMIVHAHKTSRGVNLFKWAEEDSYGLGWGAVEVYFLLKAGQREREAGGLQPEFMSSYFLLLFFPPICKWDHLQAPRDVQGKKTNTWNTESKTNMRSEDIQTQTSESLPTQTSCQDDSRTSKMAAAGGVLFGTTWRSAALTPNSVTPQRSFWLQVSFSII